MNTGMAMLDIADVNKRIRLAYAQGDTSGYQRGLDAGMTKGERISWGAEQYLSTLGQVRSFIEWEGYVFPNGKVTIKGKRTPDMIWVLKTVCKVLKIDIDHGEKA